MGRQIFEEETHGGRVLESSNGGEKCLRLTSNNIAHSKYTFGLMIAEPGVSTILDKVPRQLSQQIFHRDSNR